MSKSKDKAKPSLPTRPHDAKKASLNGVKKEKKARSVKSSPRSRGSTATSTPTSASPAPEAVKQEGREASDSASEGSVKDFYAHIEASSSESSRWDTDSVLGAVLEDLTDETDIVGEFCP